MATTPTTVNALVQMLPVSLGHDLSASLDSAVGTGVGSNSSVGNNDNGATNGDSGSVSGSVSDSTLTLGLEKKKPGRSPSQIWTLLTDDPHPQRSVAATCKHCKEQVMYYKKSEQMIRHLKKCTEFHAIQHQYAFSTQYRDVLHQYNQMISTKQPSKKRQKASVATATAVPTTTALVTHVPSALDHAALHHAQAMNQLAMAQSMPDVALLDSVAAVATAAAMDLKDTSTRELSKAATGYKRNNSSSNVAKTKTSTNSSTNTNSPGLSTTQLELMDEAIAMHAYVTGMAFDTVDECHLQRAFAIARPHATLPTPERLTTDLLQRCYDKMHKQVWHHLTASAVRVCLQRDAWSNTNVYALNDSDSDGSSFVTYMATTSDKQLFLESEHVLNDRDDVNSQYKSLVIAHDIKRVLAPIADCVSGVVTGSTDVDAGAWELLKAEYPTKFFYGCIAHALHLMIGDIFGGNDARQQQHRTPLAFPFDELVTFTTDCNELLAFFSSYQFPQHVDVFDPQTLALLQRVVAAPTASSTSSTILQWGTLAARFRVLQQLQATIHAIVRDPAFVAAAPKNQHVLRDALKTFVMDVKWQRTLEKALSILTPIELTLLKFQDADKPISEVYYESKHLLADFDAVFGLAAGELEYLKRVVTDRWQYVLSEAHGLAFVLDPRFIGKSMTREYREQIEELIFHFPAPYDAREEGDHDDGTTIDNRKRALVAEYTDYVAFAKNQRATRTFQWDALEKGHRSPLQFWQLDAANWPTLQPLALTLFSLAPSSVGSDKTLCQATLCDLRRRNELSVDDMRCLAFICINDTQFSGSSSRANSSSNSNSSSTGGSSSDAPQPHNAHTNNAAAAAAAATLPDFTMGSSSDTALSPEGMMMWMI